MEIVLSQWNKHPDICQTDKSDNVRTNSEKIDKSPSEPPLPQKNIR